MRKGHGRQTDGGFRIVAGTLRVPKLATERRSIYRGPQSPGGFTLVELLVVIAIIGILVALLLPAIQAAREAARRTQCQTNLHNIALGLLNYHDANKSFPFAIWVPTNKTTGGLIITNGPGQGFADKDSRFYGGWATQILPFIEEQALYDSFEFYGEALPGGGTSVAMLNSFPNRIPRGTPIQYMMCPSDIGANNYCSLSGGNWARGNYGFNMGLGFLFFHWPNLADPDYMKNNYAWNQHCGRGVSTINKGGKIAQLEDGTTSTIMLAELRVGLSDRDRRGTWAMPMVGANLLCSHASNYAGPPNDCSPGGDDLANAGDVIADVGEGNLTSECMMPYNSDSWGVSAQTTARSRHPGGVHVAMCDGSVRFISDDVQFVALGPHLGQGEQCPDEQHQNEFAIWQRLNSANDGYVVDGSSF